MLDRMRYLQYLGKSLPLVKSAFDIFAFDRPLSLAFPYEILSVLYLPGNVVHFSQSPTPPTIQLPKGLDAYLRLFQQAGNPLHMWDAAERFAEHLRRDPHASIIVPRDTLLAPVLQDLIQSPNAPQGVRMDIHPHNLDDWLRRTKGLPFKHFPMIFTGDEPDWHVMRSYLRNNRYLRAWAKAFNEKPESAARLLRHAFSRLSSSSSAGTIWHALTESNVGTLMSPEVVTLSPSTIQHEMVHAVSPLRGSLAIYGAQGKPTRRLITHELAALAQLPYFFREENRHFANLGLRPLGALQHALAWDQFHTGQRFYVMDAELPTSYATSPTWRARYRTYLDRYRKVLEESDDVSRIARRVHRMPLRLRAAAQHAVNQTLYPLYFLAALDTMSRSSGPVEPGRMRGRWGGRMSDFYASLFGLSPKYPVYETLLKGPATRDELHDALNYLLRRTGLSLKDVTPASYGKWENRMWNILKSILSRMHR